MKFLLTLFLSLSLTSCRGQSSYNDTIRAAAPTHIQRFDKDLYRLIESGDTTLQDTLLMRYPDMLDIIGKGILNLRSVQEPNFFGKLRQFYSEPTLRGLYRDAITRYDSIGDIEQTLGQAFAYLKINFPTMQIPAVYMHVSGLNQNVLVGDSLLSLSIDKYMGEEYPLYQNFFYESQRRKMCRERVISDYLTGWLMSEYPFTGKENVLLERMIYEGKIKEVVSLALDNPDPAQLMGYTPEELTWCEQNEATIWKAIIERKHLYTPDLLTTAQYFEDSDTLFPGNEAPGNLGTWIGWRIVKRYMEETGTSPQHLMSQDDAQAILTTSKYKP